MFYLLHSKGSGGNNRETKRELPPPGQFDRGANRGLGLELADGQVNRLGTAQHVGNATIEQKVTLTGVKDKPKRAMINYHNDVLATMN